MAILLTKFSNLNATLRQGKLELANLAQQRQTSTATGVSGGFHGFSCNFSIIHKKNEKSTRADGLPHANLALQVQAGETMWQSKLALPWPFSQRHFPVKARLEVLVVA